MKKLFKYMRGYRKECVLGPLFKLFEATLELFVPLIVASVIDTGIANSDNGYIIKMCLLLVAIGFMGLIAAVTAQFFAAKAAVGFITRLKHALFEHITRLSYSTNDQIGTSTLITRMTSDMNQVQTGINLALRLLLRSPFVVFGAMIMAFFVDVKAALIFVVVIPVLSVVVFGIMLISIPLYKRVRARLDKVLLRVRENLTGVRVLRAFCKENDEIEAFKEENEAFTVIQKTVGRVSALLNPVTFIIVNIAVIMLVYTGALRVEAGLLTGGAVVALYNYMSQILVELIKLADLIINITKSVACLNRIGDVLDTANDQAVEKDYDTDRDGAVEFEDVSLCYKGAGEASLKNISFKANSGEIIGVIGGTGSGKTSLVSLIPRLYDATSGRVTVDGKDVNTLSTDALREKVAIVPQKAVLFAGSIRSNMLWGNENADDDMIWAALRAAQAAEFVEKLPQGLDSVVEQGGKNFSGGQRQRLTIARALVKQAPILILDDSSSALDYATDARLREAVLTLPWKPCVFVVSQRTSSIQHANLILVLEDGALVGIGKHEQLLEDCEIYREIHESQFGKGAADNG